MRELILKALQGTLSADEKAQLATLVVIHPELADILGLHPPFEDFPTLCQVPLPNREQRQTDNESASVRFSPEMPSSLVYVLGEHGRAEDDVDVGADTDTAGGEDLGYVAEVDYKKLLEAVYRLERAVQESLLPRSPAGEPHWDDQHQYSTALLEQLLDRHGLAGRRCRVSTEEQCPGWGYQCGAIIERGSAGVVEFFHEGWRWLLCRECARYRRKQLEAAAEAAEAEDQGWLFRNYGF